MPENPDAGLVVVGTESDNPFAIDVAVFCLQGTDVADLLSLKTFSNSEFCPRFISDVNDMERIGRRLEGRTVAIVSTSSAVRNRNELAWRTLLVARAAADNGAARIVLVEPDLFFSAQDRGPRPEQGEVDFERGAGDYKKFDGQPFTSRLYAQVLALAGVDSVMTVHNHSASVTRAFSAAMSRGFVNLSPADVFAHYLRNSDVAPAFRAGRPLVLCSPDKGARGFTEEVARRLGPGASQLLVLAKQRLGERSTSAAVAADSPSSLAEVAGGEVVVLDDMVRTGATITECCRLLKAAGAERVVFLVTHFHSSPESRENLFTPAIDEIVTTNTIPAILNRDTQGRLRRKLTVIKLEKWMSYHSLSFLGLGASHLSQPHYSVDMSSKNPRYRTSAAVKCEG